MKLSLKEKQLVKEYAKKLVGRRIDESKSYGFAMDHAESPEYVQIFPLKNNSRGDDEYKCKPEELIPYLIDYFEDDGKIKTIAVADSIPSPIAQILKIEAKKNKFKFEIFETGDDEEEDEDEDDISAKKPPPDQQKILTAIQSQLEQYKFDIGPGFDGTDNIGLKNKRVLTIRRWGHGVSQYHYSRVKKIEDAFMQKYPNVIITHTTEKQYNGPYSGNKTPGDYDVIVLTVKFKKS